MSGHARELGVPLSSLVAHGFATTIRGDDSVIMTGVRHDSRTVEPGDLFVAISGHEVDGLAFVPDALARGAVAVLADRDPGVRVRAPLAVAEDARRALSPVAELVYGNPTRALEVVGITGTNGKTTTAWLVEAALAHAGARPAMIGTVVTRGPGVDEPATFTTPEGDDLARFASRVRASGATHLVMEVSSHGLALHRADGCHFRVAAFTNLTQDHLDFHGSFAAYGEAKARLFTELAPEVSVIHVDDPFGRSLAARAGGRVIRCSSGEAREAEVRLQDFRIDREGIRAHVSVPDGEVTLKSPMLGHHNIENLLVALGVGVGLGLPAAQVAEGLARAEGAPGRLERVPHPGDVAVLVDYAHTPDALARALVAVRAVTPGRLFVVFGCGGDRDRDKRPRMGAAAARGADLVVVTSDNPRTEDPRSIVEAIEPGVREGGQPAIRGDLGEAERGYLIEVDRRSAIQKAICAARKGDTVLIAGKGHEDYQVVGTERRDFDDRREAMRAIERVQPKEGTP